MMLDGVKPGRGIFHSLLIGTMKGACLQDAFFFCDQIKAMGFIPDVSLYNFLISTCGKCKNFEQAVRLLEEMKRFEFIEVKPTGQTYICLFNASEVAGLLTECKKVAQWLQLYLLLIHSWSCQHVKTCADVYLVNCTIRSFMQWIVWNAVNS